MSDEVIILFSNSVDNTARAKSVAYEVALFYEEAFSLVLAHTLEQHAKEEVGHCGESGEQIEKRGRYLLRSTADCAYVQISTPSIESSTLFRQYIRI